MSTENSVEPRERPAVSPEVVGVALRMTGGLVLMTTAGTVLQVVVIAFLGHLGGDALYLRSVYLPFGFLTLAVTEGLVIGVQVIVARKQRQGAREEAGPVLGVACALGSCGLLAVAAVTWLLSAPLSTVLAVAEPDRSRVWLFVIATVAGNAVAVLPTFAGAALRGLGRTRAAGALAALEAVLILAAVFGVHDVWGIGALSVPIGFVVGSVPVAAGAWVLVLRAGVRPRRAERSSPVIGPLRDIALPVAGSFLVLSAGATGYLHLIAGAGPEAVAGFGLGQSVQTFLIVPATAIGSAASIAIALRGTPGDARGDAPLRLLLRLAVPTYVVLAAAVFVLRAPLVALFADSAPVRLVAEDYLAVVGPSLLLLGVTLAVLTYLEQAGHATAALVLNVTFFAVVLAIGKLWADPLPPHALIVLIAVANVPGFCCVLTAARGLLRRTVGRSS